MLPNRLAIGNGWAAGSEKKKTTLPIEWTLRVAARITSTYSAETAEIAHRARIILKFPRFNGNWGLLRPTELVITMSVRSSLIFSSRQGMTFMGWLRIVPALIACVSVGRPLVARGASMQEVVQATKASFAPASPNDAQRAKEALQQQIEVLDRYLKSLGANGDHWKRYLMWSEMQHELAAGTEARTSDLREVALQYFADFPGLEMPQFRNVGHALRRYANTLYASREDKLAEKYAAAVDEVAKRLSDYSAKPDEAQAAYINNELRWLARYGKPDGLLKRVRNEYSRPNLF
jgi:hypothetical protein